MIHFQNVLRTNSVSRFSLISEPGSNPRRLFALFSPELGKLKYTRRIFKVDFLKNIKHQTNETLYQAFSLFFHAESSPRRVQSNSFRRSHPASLSTPTNNRVATKSLWIKMFLGLFEIPALKIVDQVDVRFTAEGTFVLSHVAHKVRENKLHLCSKLSIKKCC